MCFCLTTHLLCRRLIGDEDFARCRARRPPQHEHPNDDGPNRNEEGEDSTKTHDFRLLEGDAQDKDGKYDALALLQNEVVVIPVAIAE